MLRKQSIQRRKLKLQKYEVRRDESQDRVAKGKKKSLINRWKPDLAKTRVSLAVREREREGTRESECMELQKKWERNSNIEKIGEFIYITAQFWISIGFEYLILCDEKKSMGR